MTLEQPGMKLPFALPKEREDAATSLPLTVKSGHDTQAAWNETAIRTP